MTDVQTQPTDFCTLPVIANIPILNVYQIKSDIPGKNPFDIYGFFERCGVNMQYIWVAYRFHELDGFRNKKIENKLYQRLYRRICKLNNDGIIKINKIDGFLWIYDKEDYFSCIIGNKHRSKDLLIPQESKNQPKRKDTPQSSRRRLLQKKYAIQLCKTKTMLNPADREVLKKQFEQYQQRYETKTIEYGQKTGNDSELTTIHKGTCNTRFNNSSRRSHQIMKHQNCWKNASTRFKTGVILTLTTDPKKFGNIYESHKHFAHEFNRFMANISYHLPKPISYICAHEFTETGLHHGHLVIFGIPFLHSKDNTEEKAWIRKRWTQGKRVDSEEIALDQVHDIWYRIKTDKRTDTSQCPGENTYYYTGMDLIENRNTELYWAFDQQYFNNSDDLVSTEPI